MQTSLYKQKLIRRWQKVLETKKLWQFSPTDIILGFVKTEKTDNQTRIVSKVKVPVLDKNWSKVKEKYEAIFRGYKHVADYDSNDNKIGYKKVKKEERRIEKERVKVEEKIKEINKITFKVMKWANKNDVKQSLKLLYNLDVEKVNIIKNPYKHRQRRGLVRKSFVKAVVTLKEGQKMPSLDKLV